MHITIFGSANNEFAVPFQAKIVKLLSALEGFKGFEGFKRLTLIYGGGNEGLIGLIRNYKGSTISINAIEYLIPGVAETYILPTLMERQQKLIELGDIYLFLPGSSGTAFELFDIFVRRRKEIKPLKPILIFNVHGFYTHLIAHIKQYNNLESVYIYDTFEAIIEFLSVFTPSHI